MSDQQSRIIDWLDDVLVWLREPLTAMPVERVLERLHGAFQVNVSSWTSQEDTVMTAMIFNPVGIMAAHSAVMTEFMAGQHRDCHPLSAWYQRTMSAAPQTAARVPTGLVPAARRQVLVAPLIRLGLEQQMTIYYRRRGIGGCFFVVARDRRDFDSDDLVLARYVQRSLVTLDRQTQTLRGSQSSHSPVSALSPGRADLGLTGRELAVLQLLSDGLSTRQAARRLACSPRTVDKHLQHGYRKLGVRDRVNAIRVARLAGAVLELSPFDSARVQARAE